MRAPDLNAPRFRYKFTDICSKKLIRAFKEKYPEYSKYKDKDLIKAIGAHNKAITQEVMDTRDGIELQSDLGYVFIGMTHPSKKNKRNIAWGKSIQLGMKVFHKNWETNNTIGKIYYCNYDKRYRFENRQLWKFTPTRPFSRTASTAILKNWQMYVILDPTIYIWKLFERNVNKVKSKALTKKRLHNYNDFEMED